MDQRNGVTRSGGRMWVDPGMSITQSQAAVAYDASTQSAALSAQCKSVLVTSTTDCFITVGTNPTATTSKHFLPAYIPQRLSIPWDASGATQQKIAAIKSSTAGNLYISELG